MHREPVDARDQGAQDPIGAAGYSAGGSGCVVGPGEERLKLSTADDAAPSGLARSQSSGPDEIKDQVAADRAALAFQSWPDGTAMY